MNVELDEATESTPLLIRDQYTYVGPSSQLVAEIYGLEAELAASSGDHLNVPAVEDIERSGETFDNVPKVKRQLGTLSAVFLIFNRVIGTGIYATPSTILRASNGSVGVSLLMWLLGALIAATGTAVYVELGTGLPRSGGEKNYLEYLYRWPLYLVTCTYAVYAIITGSATANSIVFGEYLSNAISPAQPSSDLPAPKPEVFPFPPSLSPLPGVPSIPSLKILLSSPSLLAALALTLPVLLHGMFPVKIGLRIQNTLGIFKLMILGSMAMVGLAVLLGVRDLGWDGGMGGMAWSRLWERSGEEDEGGVNRFAAGMFNVIWSFIGYSNANYALSEIRDPIRTIRVAAPLAMACVAGVYMLVNVAYFAVVTKEDILGSRRIVAALFFRNLFGEGGTERGLSLVVALSTLGNILAGQFVQARVIQELGRSGIIPYSDFFASNKPFGLPLAALCTQYFISMALLLFVPKGDAYTVLISTSSYSTSLINTLVSFGLLILSTPLYAWYIRSNEKPLPTTLPSIDPITVSSIATGSDPIQAVPPPEVQYMTSPEEPAPTEWNPPFKAWRWVVVLFFMSNVFLVLVPILIPPPGGGKTGVYETLPYWTHAAVAISVSLIGISYWYVWCRWIPWKRGYVLERMWVVNQDDGVSRYMFRKTSLKDHVAAI